MLQQTGHAEDAHSGFDALSCVSRPPSGVVRLQRFAGRAFGPGIAFVIGWDILRPKGETAMRRRTPCLAAAVAVLALAAHDPPIRLAADEPKGEGATAN
jgi:hypothetical protein